MYLDVLKNKEMVLFQFNLNRPSPPPRKSQGSLAWMKDFAATWSDYEKVLWIAFEAS
jgi:hypothetical protein